MNEETQDTTTLEDDWNDITLDDTDVVDDDAEVEIDADVEKSENAEETTPETDEADPAKQTEGEADKDQSEPEETKETDQFTLKYLGEEKSVSRDDIVPLAQKGMDYDRIRTKYDELNTEHTTLKAEKEKDDEVVGFLNELAKEQGFNDVNAFLDETKASILANREDIDISIARGRVSNERKAKELAEKETKLSAEKAEKDNATNEAQKAKEKQQADILAFAKAYPNVKPNDIPTEVWQAVKGGTSLVTAYKEYSLTQREAKIAEQEAKLEADKKNAENKKRSTGSRASVGKTTKQDDFDKLWYDGE